MKEERGITLIDIFISSLISFVKIYCGTIFCSYTLITSGYYTLCNLSSDSTSPTDFISSLTIKSTSVLNSESLFKIS